MNPYSSPRFLFRIAVFANSNLTLDHLQKHLKTRHPSLQKKSTAFFESSLQNDSQQLSIFDKNMAKERNNNFVLASFQMAHVVIERKLPYTELESVVLPCLEIADDKIHGGKKAIAKVGKFL